MAERKILVMNSSEGYHEEHDVAADTFTMLGLTMTGNIALTAGARVTGVPNTPTAATDAVNQNYVDNAISGIKWKDMVQVVHLIGNANVATINGLSPSAGHAYVMTDSGTLTAGSLSVATGDLVEYDGSAWQMIQTNSGGYPPDGTRAILSTTQALISPYTDGTDDGKVMEFDGTSLTGSASGDAVEGNAVLVQGDETDGYYFNLGFVFDGTVPTGEWIQFTGVGQIVAGAGLAKSGNTLSVNFGAGIREDSDYVAIDLYDTNPGLELVGSGNTAELAVKLKSNYGIDKDADGLLIKIDDTPDTLDVDADGLKVVGLPSLFKINDVAVGATVTAPNLDDLTDGSNADSLHTHTISSTEYASRVEAAILNNVTVTAGQVVRWSSTNNEITPADNSTAAGSRAIGLARTGGAANPGTSQVVKIGDCATALTSQTVNTPKFLGASGALVDFGSIPTPGRVIRVGFMKNATDIDVAIADLGYKR